MKSMLKVGLTLALICAVAATALAAVNLVTKDRIAQYEFEVVQNALLEVADGYNVGELQEVADEIVREYYPLANAAQELQGYILMLSGNGYGGEMSIMASYDVDGQILGVKLLANSETPGLGKKAEQDSYMEMFVGTGSRSLVPVKKNDLAPAAAESISGATVTFNSIAKALAYGSEYAKRLER